MDDKGLLNQLIESGQFRFLQGELSLIRANPLSAPPAAPSSVLSIRYPGHTRLWTGGGASAGSEIGWLTSGWTPPTRFLAIRIGDPLAIPIDRGSAWASGLIIPANQILAFSLLKTGLRSLSWVFWFHLGGFDSFARRSVCKAISGGQFRRTGNRLVPAPTEV